MPADEDCNGVQETSILSAAQERAAQMIATGSRGKVVAEALGVTETMVSRWRKTPQFQATVNLIQQRSREAAVAHLYSLVPQALETVQAVMADPKASASDRMKAATLILDRLGLDNVGKVGPTDAAEIEAQTRKADRHRDLFKGA